MAISERTYKIIWGMFAGRCAICREACIEKNESGRESLIGEVAHIVAAQEDAPRGRHSMPVAQRDGTDNLMLLCRKHHKIVDDDPTHYSIDLLHSTRKEYLDWLTTRLQKPCPWTAKISQLCYINVPRLCELAELNGYKVDLSAYRSGRTLHSLGWELNRVMAQFKEVLGLFSISSVPVQSIEFVHEGYIGGVVSFDRTNFRTKNIPIDALKRSNARPINFSGDLSKDPHIYFRKSAFTFVINIDPTWITTSTAFTLFRPSGGQSTFSGLARISNVDYGERVMTATPWVVGLPPSFFHAMFGEGEC